MVQRNAAETSPLKTGLIHGSASLLTFSALASLMGLTIHLTGDVAAAGPSEVVALFEPHNAPQPALKSRFDEPVLLSNLTAPRIDEHAYDINEALPQLNVPAPHEEAPRPAPQPAPQVIRINGRAVPIGRSLSEVTAKITLPSTPITGLYEKTAKGYLPKLADDGRRPEYAYARPFENPEGRPTVSLIVGGLGINRTTTKAAINELPPEVSLSFVPHAANLSHLIRQARAAGHEVLIELPMEAYENGRARAHPKTLKRDASEAVNHDRLLFLLGRTTGYYGAINYQGSKYASDATATTALLGTLARRGVAFIEDGSLTDSTFETSARQTGVGFAKAGTVIDADLDGNQIETQLLTLETRARRHGQALGTGFAYPLTIDMVKDWCASLPGKGLTLAPASTLSKASPYLSDDTKPIRSAGGTP